MIIIITFVFLILFKKFYNLLLKKHTRELSLPKIRILLAKNKDVEIVSGSKNQLNINYNSIEKNVSKILIKNNILNIDDEIIDNTNNIYINSTHFYLNKEKYFGQIQIIFEGDDIYYINHIHLEKYLYNVVTSEVYSFWPIESLKAQAVVSRTYALRKMKKYKNYKFDLYASIKSQKYSGNIIINKKIIEAVNATENIIISYNNKIINAVYHSCSGGITEFSDSVWGKQLPYLNSVIDIYINSPYLKWKEEINIDKIKEKFLNNDDLVDIFVSKKSKTGRVH